MDKGGNYESFINRKVAIMISFFGLVEVLAGILIVICGFIMFGAFCENLSCEYISDGIGFWLGFPLLIPGILGLVVLGTRHTMSVMAFMVTNILVLILSIVHTILTFNDYDDFWDQHNDWYNAGKCTPLGGNQCECIGNVNRVLGYRCDLIEFGYDLNWVLFGASIATIFLTIISVILGIVGIALVRPAPRRS